MNRPHFLPLRRLGFSGSDANRIKDTSRETAHLSFWAAVSSALMHVDSQTLPPLSPSGDTVDVPEFTHSGYYLGSINFTRFDRTHEHRGHFTSHPFKDEIKHFAHHAAIN